MDRSFDGAFRFRELSAIPTFAALHAAMAPNASDDGSRLVRKHRNASDDTFAAHFSVSRRKTRLGKIVFTTILLYLFVY